MEPRTGQVHSPSHGGFRYRCSWEWGHRGLNDWCRAGTPGHRNSGRTKDGAVRTKNGARRRGTKVGRNIAHRPQTRRPSARTVVRACVRTRARTREPATQGVLSLKRTCGNSISRSDTMAALHTFGLCASRGPPGFPVWRSIGATPWAGSRGPCVLPPSCSSNLAVDWTGCTGCSNQLAHKNHVVSNPADVHAPEARSRGSRPAGLH